MNKNGSISTYTFTDTSSGFVKEKAFCRICGVPLWTIPASAKGTYLLIRTAILQNRLVCGQRVRLVAYDLLTFTGPNFVQEARFL